MFIIFFRERREAEAREMEKRDREREAKLEREKREEARSAEQAVHKHFQESLRLAHQKVSFIIIIYNFKFQLHIYFYKLIKF